MSPLFRLNHDVEMIGYGIFFFIGSILIAPLYFFVILTIHRRDKRKPNLSYKLMNIINILQLIQGLGHFVTSPVLIFPNIQTSFDPVIRVIGCLMNTCWIVDLPVMALLAVSRILIFSRLIDPNEVSPFIKVALVLIGSWGTFVFVCGAVLQNMKFSVPWWGYDFSAPFTHLFDTLELSLSFPCLVISYCSYLAIIYQIYVKKKLKSSVQSRKNEIAILLQYTFVTLYITCLIVVWHPTLFTFVPFIDMENTMNQAILNFLWILNCYMNPVMMLLFNESLRKYFMKNFTFKYFKTRRSSKKTIKATVVSAVSM